MNSIIVFTGNNNEFNLIPELKKQVINYMGERSIEDKVENTPHIILRGTLDTDDRTAISNMIEKFNSQSIAMLLIEVKNINNCNLSKFILDLKPIGDEV